MRKVLSVFCVLLLAGCYETVSYKSYDFYKSDIKYHQAGPDCVYYFNESGRNIKNAFGRDIKRIVYKDMQCVDLYEKHNKHTFNKKHHHHDSGNKMKLKRRWIIRNY